MIQEMKLFMGICLLVAVLAAVAQRRHPAQPKECAHWAAVEMAYTGPATADENDARCPPGETVQWIADYCMATLETDDEIAASDCIAEQSKIVFRDRCTASLHFKRALCELVVNSGARVGGVDACVEDPNFAGATVRNDGVGGR